MNFPTSDMQEADFTQCDLAPSTPLYTPFYQSGWVDRNTRLLWDALPIVASFWSGTNELLDCNEANIKFFKLRNKQELLGNFFAFSPEYQPDGQRSDVKAMALLSKVTQGRPETFEWMHQTSDGAPLPGEVTLVRLSDGSNMCMGFVRDLREYKETMQEMERRDTLVSTLNRVAAALFQFESDDFQSNIQSSMEMICKAVGVDRTSIWKNSIRDGEVYASPYLGWGDIQLQQYKHFTEDLLYREHLPGWVEKLEQGNCINGPVRDMSAKTQALMASFGILSIFLVPIFVRNEFWGVIGYSDCHNERTFSASEQPILRSASHILANATLRNDMMLRLRDTAIKLETVIAHYPGIIWSVDPDKTITLYKGSYLNRIGKASSQIEGQKIDAYLHDYPDITTNIQKTFSEGAQDFVSKIADKAYHVRTSPLLDDDGHATAVIGSFDDVTELDLLQTELQRALKAAQDANLAKSAFLAKMSHEMRTPLNAVIGLSELSLRSGEVHGTSYANLEKICGSGMTLLNLVNDLLDISKIEAGKFELHPINYCTPSLINDTATQSSLYIGEKPIRFLIDAKANLPARLCGDELRVKQIFNNLLSNAFKYTQEGTVTFEIDCVQDGETVWMIGKIRDTGIGIKAKDMNKLFADYAQMDGQANRKITGTGLGLTIAKMLAELMGGSITAESEYGKGSVFTVKLRQKSVTDKTIGAKTAENLKNFNYSNERRNNDFHRVRLHLPYARVLVVDDVITNLDVAKGMLKLYGMQVDCVTSGQQAIDAIRAETVRYSAVFMDHMMPEMDGVEATKIIREAIGSEYAKTVPIIALTANAIVGSEEMFLNNGFQAFLPKPIEMNRLDAIIRQWLRDKELEKTIAAAPHSPDHTVGGPEGQGNQDKRKQKIDLLRFGESVPGLNISKGIDRLGDEQVYFDALRSFAAHTGPLLDAAEQARLDNLANCTITFHSLKGASRSISADTVGNQAEALEKAAKAGDFSFVNANNPVFLQTARQLVADISEMLDQIAAQNPKPQKDKPDNEPLARLLAACGTHDMDEVDEAMSELEAYEYQNDDGLVAWLRDNVDQINLAKIKEKLSALNQ